MLNSISIRLYSDSLGLPRKGFVSNDNRYINLISDWIIKNNIAEKIYLLDRSRANNLISYLFNYFVEDNSYFDAPDIIIIHEGVCDCAPRPIPKKVRNIISKLPNIIRVKIINFIHNNRSILQKNGFRFVLTKPKTFFYFYKTWISQLSNTNTQVIILNILPTNDKIENQSPGFTENINKFNNIIEKVRKIYNCDNIHFIDINKIVSQMPNINDYIIEDDGHHITKKAHELLAKLILEKIDFSLIIQRD
jgi:hypothetical protein